jgi:GxxExxY protein
MPNSPAFLDTRDLNALSGEIISAAMKVHTALGPGLLESAYLAALAHELRTRSIAVEVQVPLPVVYCGVLIKRGYRIDLLAEKAIIVELKGVTQLRPIDEAQLLSYLKLSKKKLGLLINFHAYRLKDGIKRMVSNL